MIVFGELVCWIFWFWSVVIVRYEKVFLGDIIFFIYIVFKVDICWKNLECCIIIISFFEIVL